jgi:hypothetical protein
MAAGAPSCRLFARVDFRKHTDPDLVYQAVVFNRLPFTISHPSFPPYMTWSTLPGIRLLPGALCKSESSITVLDRCKL